MKEVQIIKASKDKVIRSGTTIKNKIRVAPYARVSTDSDEQKKSLNNARLDTLRDTYWKCSNVML